MISHLGVGLTNGELPRGQATFRTLMGLHWLIARGSIDSSWWLCDLIAARQVPNYGEVFTLFITKADWDAHYPPNWGGWR